MSSYYGVEESVFTLSTTETRFSLVWYLLTANTKTKGATKYLCLISNMLRPGLQPALFTLVAVWFHQTAA